MSATIPPAAAATITNFLEVRSPYDYIPSQAASLAFTIIFALITLVHCGLAIKYKYWVAFIALIPGGLLEVLGWAGRLWSHYKVLNSNPFIMQMCCLILGPAFFSAWAYTVLGLCITSLGPAFSLLKPRAYLAVFVSADVVCLVLQAIGGGMAAVAAKTGKSPNMPTKIMLSGVLVQLGTMTVFTLLALDFIIRVIAQRPYARRLRSLQRQGLWTGIPSIDSPSSSPGTPPADEETKDLSTTSPSTDLAPANKEMDRSRQLRKAKFLLVGEAFASAMIYYRGVYRSIELAQGWSGYLMTHEIYFIWLDGFPMVLCFVAFAVLYPGWLLERGPRR